MEWFFFGGGRGGNGAMNGAVLQVDDGIRVVYLAEDAVCIRCFGFLAKGPIMLLRGACRKDACRAVKQLTRIRVQLAHATRTQADQATCIKPSYITSQLKLLV